MATTTFILVVPYCMGLTKWLVSSLAYLRVITLDFNNYQIYLGIEFNCFQLLHAILGPVLISSIAYIIAGGGDDTDGEDEDQEFDAYDQQ